MGQSTKEIFKTWDVAVRSVGFRIKGSVARRENGLLQHSIGLQRSQRAAPGKIRINLYISIRDEFLDPPDWVMCLHGSVAPSRAEFGDFESWWEEARLVRDGLTALMDYGIPWLDMFGKDEETLSSWIEKANTERMSLSNLVQPVKSAHPEIDAMVSPYLKSGQAAPIDYERFLSLLKFKQGQTAVACQYARAYLRALQRSGAAISNEPDRTIRQLRKMGCSGDNTSKPN